jgi:hypothetical protein
VWLFTRYGFYSIACASQPNGAIDPGTVMIRARRAAHLSIFDLGSGRKLMT